MSKLEQTQWSARFYLASAAVCAAMFVTFLVLMPVAAFGWGVAAFWAFTSYSWAREAAKAESKKESQGETLEKAE